MKKYLLVPLITVIFIGLGAYLIWGMDLSILLKLSISTSIYLTFITILSVLLYVIGVRIMIGGMGYKVTLKSTYLVVTGGGTASFLTNVKLGIPVRIFLYRSVLGIPISVGTASIVLETTLWLLMMALIMIIPMPSIWGTNTWLLSIFPLGGVFVAAILFLYWPKLEVLIPERVFGFRTRKILDFIQSFRLGISKLGPIDLAKVILVFASTYVTNGLLLQLTLREFNWEVDLLVVIYITVFAYLVGIFSLMPMGLGTQDISLVLLLTQVGAPQDVAVAAALIQRVLRSVIPLILGLVSANILGIHRLRNSENQIVSNTPKQL